MVNCDQAPAAVYQRLLEHFRSNQEAGERRHQRPAQHHAIPRLLATALHDVWTWDLTKLPLVRRGVYLSLYVVLDLFSRFAVAWMVSRKENSALATQLMAEASARYQHHHSGLAGFTPEQVFTGRYKEVAIVKQNTLDERYALNPEHFVKGRPIVAAPPLSVAINPIVPNEDSSIIDARVNLPTLRAAGYTNECYLLANCL